MVRANPVNSFLSHAQFEVLSGSPSNLAENKKPAEFRHASFIFFFPQGQALATNRMVMVTLGCDTSSKGEQCICLAQQQEQIHLEFKIIIPIL